MPEPQKQSSGLSFATAIIVVCTVFFGIAPKGGLRVGDTFWYVVALIGVGTAVSALTWPDGEPPAKSTIAVAGLYSGLAGAALGSLLKSAMAALAR